MSKKKLLVNLLVDFGFTALFFVIYELTILRNIDVFGETSSSNNLFPDGAQVSSRFFMWALLSVIIVFVIWRIKKLGIKLLPLLTIALLLPGIVYQVNHKIFINGAGAEYKERLAIILDIKEREKNTKIESEDYYMEISMKHPIYIDDQDNEDFHVYLYMNEDLDDMYFYMKRSADSVVRTPGALICELKYPSFEGFMEFHNDFDYSKYKVIKVDDHRVQDIKIYSNFAILTRYNGTQTYFISEDFKWFLEK